MLIVRTVIIVIIILLLRAWAIPCILSQATHLLKNYRTTISCQTIHKQVQQLGAHFFSSAKLITHAIALNMVPTALWMKMMKSPILKSSNRLSQTVKVFYRDERFQRHPWKLGTTIASRGRSSFRMAMTPFISPRVTHTVTVNCKNTCSPWRATCTNAESCRSKHFAKQWPEIRYHLWQ